jgi:hypothetical protein
LSKASKSSKKQNSSTDKQHKSNQQDEDKASEENLVQQAWQKQRESEQSKMNPKEILKEEEKRANPICIEEQHQLIPHRSLVASLVTAAHLIYAQGLIDIR